MHYLQHRVAWDQQLISIKVYSMLTIGISYFGKNDLMIPSLPTHNTVGIK